MRCEHDLLRCWANVCLDCGLVLDGLVDCVDCGALVDPVEVDRIDSDGSHCLECSPIRDEFGRPRRRFGGLLIGAATTKPERNDR